MKHFEHMIYGADYNPDQWLAHPEVIEADFELMPKAGMNSMSIGIFAWKELEPEEGVYCFEWLDDIMDRLAAQGMKAVLATPSGARPYWMDRDHPEVLRVSDMGVRYHHGIRHNHCFTSPYYRKKVNEINARLAKRYQDHPALGMWHIGNEFHGECYCELCQEAFRDWLKKKYHGDIRELNEQWWTYCWSRKYSGFEEIEAPSPRGEYLLHGMNLDWKRFVTAQTVSFIENELEPIRRYTPDIPVTTNLMGRSEAIDQWKLAEVLDVVSVDSYPEWGQYGKSHARVAQFAAFTFDINRSLKKDRPFYLMECTPSLVNWYDVNKIKKPGMNELTAVQAIAHGSESVQYFQWRGARGASEKFHGTVVGHSGKDSARVFREVAALGEKLKKLDCIVGSVTRAEAALIYDWENKWAVGDLMGLTKPLDYDEICEEHYIPFWEEGVSTDIISMDHDFSTYRILVAPMLYSIRPGVAERLKQYVADGGVLILTFCAAYVNENDLCFLGGFPGDGLMEVTGLEAEEIDALYPEEYNEIAVLSEDAGAAPGSRYRSRSLCEVVNLREGCRSLAVYTQDFYQEKPAVTVHPYGKGQCYYFATRVETDFLRAFYHRRVAEIGIVRNMAAPLPLGVTVQRRLKGTEIFDFVLNFTDTEQRVKLEENAAYMDVLEQKRVAEREILLPPFGYRILSHSQADAPFPGA
ncbi:MAG: beta-galactosidase [Bacteroidales bacterium]|nr:beta-galactosidase [Bacteroidales bacterium]MCM1416196.1 beta-galactosidase [bacterium]MCM1424642.1 beta-galactosidase [bacterium]